MFHNHCVCFSIYEIFNIIIHIFYFSGQPRSSLETKKNSITDDYTISQTVLGLGINGKGGLISETVLISINVYGRFSCKDLCMKKDKTFKVGYFTTISGHFWAIYIYIFHKIEVQIIILRCLTSLNSNWIRTYNINHNFFWQLFFSIL